MHLPVPTFKPKTYPIYQQFLQQPCLMFNFCLPGMCVSSRMCARSLSAAANVWRGRRRGTLRPHGGNSTKWRRRATLCSTHAGPFGPRLWITSWRWEKTMLSEVKILPFQHSVFVPVASKKDWIFQCNDTTTPAAGTALNLAFSILIINLNPVLHFNGLDFVVCLFYLYLHFIFTVAVRCHQCAPCVSRIIIIKLD